MTTPNAVRCRIRSRPSTPRPDFTLTVALAQSAEHRNVDTLFGASDGRIPRASECRTVPSAAPDGHAKVSDKVSAGAPSRTWRLTPTGYASEDPTTRAAWMVQGETDAGPQRRCVACRQWWPLEKDHWVRRPRAKGRTGYIQPCKACRVENGLADS